MSSLVFGEACLDRVNREFPARRLCTRGGATRGRGHRTVPNPEPVKSIRGGWPETSSSTCA